MEKHLTQKDLAERWNVSVRTLERWRSLGEGPRFLRLGRRIVYRHADVESFERAHLNMTAEDRRVTAAGVQ